MLANQVHTEPTQLFGTSLMALTMFELDNCGMLPNTKMLSPNASKQEISERAERGVGQARDLPLLSAKSLRWR